MPKMVLLDARVFCAGADLSGSGNKIELSVSEEEKETTNWRSGGAKEVLAGISSVSIAAAGQWEAGDPGLPDDVFWATRRTIDPWSFGATAASDTGVGSRAWLTRALRTSLKLFDQVGEVAPWEASVTGSWPLARGVFAHPSGTARTTTGNGTALDLGAVPDGQHLYASLHVLSVAGTTPTLTVLVASDDEQAFGGSPETQMTFATANAVGGQILRVPGAIADDWFRVQWTIGGTDPSFLFVVALGIA